MRPDNVKTVLFLGRTSPAKSSLLFKCGVHWAEQGSKVVYISATPLAGLPPPIHGTPALSSEALTNIRFLITSSRRSSTTNAVVHERWSRTSTCSITTLLVWQAFPVVASWSWPGQASKGDPSANCDDTQLWLAAVSMRALTARPLTTTGMRSSTHSSTLTCPRLGPSVVVISGCAGVAGRVSASPPAARLPTDRSVGLLVDIGCALGSPHVSGRCHSGTSGISVAAPRQSHVCATPVAGVPANCCCQVPAYVARSSETPILASPPRCCVQNHDSRRAGVLLPGSRQTLR
ncbi:uncharacterized protein LOC134527112 isoform X2 [Bacillus rossius redtenbacheri]|uniref:uncharacterized protein LOC134527112 isoform X2 n=1 Tax=Bacillus rossius redtenbacheri TaxID=93214 RepID=UPI002FDEC515